MSKVAVKPLTELQKFLKLMTLGEGKNFSPLGRLVKAGNLKIPNTTGIFNMGSAHDCPSLRLGECTAYDENGKHICYAMKAENEMRKEVEPFRNRQKRYWLSTTAEQFVVHFLIMNQLKNLPFNALRLNESGDFWSQKCVDKAENIARMLKHYGIKVYCYTHRKYLDYSKCKTLVVNGSGFKTQGVKNIFKIVKSLDDRPAGYGICVADCRVCDRCMKSGLKTVVVKH